MAQEILASAPAENAAATPQPALSPARRHWRPTIAVVLIFGFALLVLVAVSSVMWVALGTAQKNTIALLRQTADFSVATLIDQIGIHLGAARSQSEFLAEMIGRGEISEADRDNLSDGLLGALAAAPQVTGIGYFSVEGWSLRIGRGKYGIIRPFDPQEPDPAIREISMASR